MSIIFIKLVTELAKQKGISDSDYLASYAMGVNQLVKDPGQPGIMTTIKACMKIMPGRLH